MDSQKSSPKDNAPAPETSAPAAGHTAGRDPIRKNGASYLDQIVDAGRSHEVGNWASLSGALKFGVRLMRVLMIVLAGVFLFSNIFWVPEGYVAVQTRLGKITLKKEGLLRPPGGPYLAYPYPVDKVIRIPTTIRTLVLSNEFWYAVGSASPMQGASESAARASVDNRPLSYIFVPGLHGSLVTADKNIVQGVWIIHYQLAYHPGENEGGDAVDHFIGNVGTMEKADEIITRIAASAIIHVVSNTNVADFVAGQIDNDEIRRIVATRLAALETGLDITSVSASQYAVPRILESDFQAVTEAGSQKALEIETASRFRLSTLNELVGSGWQGLLDAVDDHEQALRNNDRTAEQAAFRKAEALFISDGVGGRIKQMIDEARSEKTATIQRARASAARFSELLPAFRKNPDIVESQLLQETISGIWSNVNTQAFYIPKEQTLYINLDAQAEDSGDEMAYTE